MKISIVIPSFNQGAFIQRTIDSILNQDYADLEILVMDGGSTDQTIDVLKTYGDRIYWRSAPDRGQTQAVNLGWKQAAGQILGWVNSDDVLLPGALKIVAEAFERNPGIKWLYGNCQYIDSTDRFIGDYAVQPFNFEMLVGAVQNFIPQPSVFIQRNIVNEIGFLNEDLQYVMDLEYWLRVGLKYPALYIPLPLSCLRLHTNAKSIAAFDKFSYELSAVMEALFARPDLPENIRVLEKTSLAKTYLLAADMNFWAGNSKTAARFALKSWQVQPLRLRRLYLYLLSGRLGKWIARRKHANPYEMRIPG